MRHNVRCWQWRKHSAILDSQGTDSHIRFTETHRHHTKIPTQLPVPKSQPKNSEIPAEHPKRVLRKLYATSSNRRAASSNRKAAFIILHATTTISCNTQEKDRHSDWNHPRGPSGILAANYNHTHRVWNPAFAIRIFLHQNLKHSFAHHKIIERFQTGQKCVFTLPHQAYDTIRAIKTTLNADLNHFTKV